ncbi:hypothetical protein WR25_19552 [Diploscapter pachys]|uniref:C2H2-type domain-containing protein n=1 Tax=Diploscapter pachys TaxID=2018661 RepID=A0A2A2JE88_9BILA|nr:hypothetical protein WR25_19552 [Diploscapter pachys]
MSSRRRMQSGDERDKLGVEVEGGGGQQQDNELEVEQEEDGQVTANDELLSPESDGRMEKRRMARVIVAEQDGGTPKQTATEQDLGSRSSRIAGRGVLPCDDDANGVFPCPVFDCDLPPFDNRAIRNYHLRTEHPGYLYTNGDYERKMAGRPPEEVHQRPKPRQKTMSGGRIQKANKMFDMPLDLQEDVKPKDALNIGYDSGYSLFENQRGNPLGQSSSRFSPMSMSDRQAMQVQTEQLPMNANNRNYTIGEQYSPHEIQVGAEEIYTMEETMYETEQILNEDYEKMDEEDRKMMDAFYPHVVSHHSRLNILRNKRRGRPKNEEGQEPGPTSKIRIGDPNGKYGCYVKSCPWRGGYRSIRAAHMKWCHKDWVMPSRFLLQRMSREATMIAPGHVNIEPEPEFSCLVAGCPWKGNYRATRAAHMRTHHPNYEYPKKKASVGGYIPDGKYMCHISGCEWRGSSRSTRATHMRKAHPGVRTQQYSARTVACADCELQCNSHKHFVDHMAIEHHIGGIVQREFTDIRDYEEWFGAVQEAFSIEFVRKMSIKQTEHYQVMYMYCTRSGGYRPRRIRQTEPYMPEYTKRRTVRSKVGKNCAAFLRIVHWTDSHITVVGCIEHTGHRMGTSLLRLSPLEREALDEYLYVWDEEAPLDMALERLREMDGYSIEGYEATEKTVEDVKQFVQDENELMSLEKLVKGQLKDSVFGVNLVDENGEVLSSNFSVGIMSPHMKDLWIKHSHRAVCIEEVHLMLGGKWDVSLYFVMVFDEREIPRCAAIYLSSVSDHEKLLRNLAGIYEGGSQLDTFVTDGSQEWVQAFTNVFGNKAYTMDLQIAEWHVLSDWTVHCDYLVPNKIDKFQILCVLRRWLR